MREFAPLADATTPGVLMEVSNLLPSDRGWRAAYALADAGVETLTATCVGAALVLGQDDVYDTYAGTDETLWGRSGATWANLTEAATTYSANADQRWRWATMGDFVLAANQSDTVQVSAGGATFTAITGAPKAGVIESVAGFIMAASTIDASYGAQPDRWWCSAIFDHTDWTPALETQATTGRLVDTPGPIRGLRRLGKAIVAYKDSSLYLGEYVQPPTVWGWSLISSDVGCASHDAVVNLGRIHLFMGPRNFFAFDGAQVTPIGDAVAEWFFEQELLRSYDNRVQAVHDWQNALVYWFYPSAELATGALTKALCYQYRSGRWGVVEHAVECAIDYVGSAITYDTLGDYFGTWDAGISRVYDSPLWIPDTVSPAVFDSNHVLKTLDGAGMAARFKTGHYGDDQFYSLLRRVRVRWLTAPATATLNLYTTDEHGSALTARAAAVQANNKFDLLASARWHQIEVSTTGDAEFTALALDLEPQGAW